MALAAGVPARSGFHRLRVAAVDRLCDDAAAVSFEVPAALAASYRFLPGQSLTLRRILAGDDHRRSYSICAAVGASPRIGVREVPGGLFSEWLVRAVRAGDEIEVSMPAGRFTPDLDRAGDHVAIAAGSGITPVLSVVASLLARTTSTVTLLYGNRRGDTVMFAEELADLKDRHPARLHLVHVLSREAREPELFTGRLDEGKLRALLGALVEPARVDHWWLCGPHGMVTGARRVLADLAVEPDRCHQELFYVDEVPPETVRAAEPTAGAVASTVSIVLDGRSTTVALPPGITVLDGAQRARPDLPFACKGGVCGTCRARVTAGEVTMRRNFALEPAELDAGMVLTCQALPRSDRVTVDYDV